MVLIARAWPCRYMSVLIILILHMMHGLLRIDDIGVIAAIVLQWNLPISRIPSSEEVPSFQRLFSTLLYVAAWA